MPRELIDGHSLGIEYETENIPQNGVSSFVRDLGFSGTHDASIESEICYVDGVRVAGRNILQTQKATDFHVCGVELVSSPFDLRNDNVLKTLMSLTQWLTQEGELPESNRAGIHYHIGLRSPGIKTLKRLIRWGRHLEALFFRLGGNGYTFRGVTNDSAFCRPITKSGPPCVPYASGWAQCFDIDHLLDANTLSEFWHRYGNSNAGDVPRYVAQRYTWLNFYSILAHRTIEVRVFNKTLNPFFMMAEIDLFQHMVLSSMEGDGVIPDEEISVYDNPSDPVLLRQLAHLSKLWKLEDQTVSYLQKIIQRTPPVVLDPKPVITHLTETMSIRSPWSTEGDYEPTIVHKPAKARVVTIHTLRRERAEDRMRDSIASVRRS